MGLKLNCGSGQRPFAKPWVNVDAQARWEPDLVADCASLPYDDGSCDMIVMHHIAEHYGSGEAGGLFQEAYRLLAPGGLLLVFVPDMRALAQRWLMGTLDDETYLINVYGAYMGDEHDRHRFGFTEATLRKELSRLDWAGVKRFNWRQVEGASLARDWWVLAMECVR